MAPTRARPRLWHGGAPGRQPGDLLLPPSETGLAYTRATMSAEKGFQGQIAQSSALVYVTTDRELARAYASGWSLDGLTLGGGSLYRVDADELEPDQDLLSLPGVSFQTAQARVLTVYDAYVPLDRVRSSRTFERVLRAHDHNKKLPGL